MRAQNYFHPKWLLVSIALGASVGAHAFDTWNASIVGVSNTGGPGIHSLDSVWSNGAFAQASASKSFTGLDQSSGSRTMSFDGICRTSSSFGFLHSYSELHATNVYYNANNPSYQHPDGSIDENGSPETLVSLGFAGFNDTLHFGGSLQSGYKARYIFHCSGTNSGVGYLADMAFGIEGYQDESFFSFGQGYNSDIWATQSYDINGITPQKVHVQFSNQVVFDLWNYDMGSNLDGVSDYSSTLVLDHIEVVDSSGNLVSGVTVTSDSGTQYQVVPEPGTLLILVGGLAAFRRARRKAN
ncbi:MAG: PEP-CTERM sorting domain-containing protein [Armatimonadetes bacterium]|nr:PEP-CTERM sorting domain-containing protein [Armatimonadota bacterium]